MVHHRSTDMQFQATCSWWMEGQCHGHQRSKNWSLYQPWKLSTSQQPMLPKKPYGYATLSVSYLYPNKPTTIYGNNQSAIALTHSGQYPACTKHIDIWYHFIIEVRSIKLIYCLMDEQMADVLMKALLSAKAKHFANVMGLHAVWGGVLRMQMCTPNYRQYK